MFTRTIIVIPVVLPYDLEDNTGFVSIFIIRLLRRTLIPVGVVQTYGLSRWIVWFPHKIARVVFDASSSCPIFGTCVAPFLVICNNQQ